MAIGHISVRSHTRSKGHSAAAAVAYRCATRVVDERTGELHDYSRRAVRGDVVENGLTAGPWGDAQDFATAIETAERRKNSMILRDVQPAIPSELNEADQVALTADFAAQLAARYDTQTLWAVHRPHARGDCRNGHAHIVLPTRRLNEAGDGFGKKLRELDCKPQSSVEVKAIRQLWETTANRYLARAKSPVRVDCGRRPGGAPMPTLGPVATALERRARPDEPPQPVTALVCESDKPPVTDAGRALAQVVLERRARKDERSKTVVSPAPPSRPPLPRPAFAPAAVDKQLARLAVVKQLRLKREREGDAREAARRVQPPPAAPAGSRAARRRGPHVPLVEVLIGAAHDGGARLSRVRSEFERLDAGDGLKRLVLQAVDPELLQAVVGPRLAPAWVEPLRANYARFKKAYPLDWVEVEKVWREQRSRWRPQHQARATRAETPQRPPAPRDRQEPATRGRGQRPPAAPTPPYRAASTRPAAFCAPLRRPEGQPTLRRVATRPAATCTPLRVPVPAPPIRRRVRTRKAAVCAPPVPAQRIEDLQRQLDQERERAVVLDLYRQLKQELPRVLSNVDGQVEVSNRTIGSVLQVLDKSNRNRTDAAADQALRWLHKQPGADERAAAERQHHKVAYEAEIAKRQEGRWVALSRNEREEAFKSVILASLPALVEKIRMVCQQVKQRVLRAHPASPAAPREPVHAAGRPRVANPPKPPLPAAGTAAAAAAARQQQPRPGHDL